jgi:hypothetical protein
MQINLDYGERMNKKLYLIPAFLIAIAMSAIMGLAVDYWARVTTYYFVPEDHGFNIAFPTTYTGAFNSTANNATLGTWISFNFTSAAQNGVQPYTNGSSSDNQVGATKPIFLVYNTGNAVSTMKLNTTTMSDFDICANSSLVGGEGSGTATCTAIEGASPVSMGTVNIGKRMNITLYGNSSAGAAGGIQTGTTYIQSTS